MVEPLTVALRNGQTIMSFALQIYNKLSIAQNFRLENYY